MTVIGTDFVDRCIFLATAGGTGSFVVSSAVTGYQTPSTAGAVNGRVYGYAAQTSDLSQWEYGYGTLSSGNTLSRTVLGNSIGNTTTISFSTAPQVTVTILAEYLKGSIFNVKAYGAVGNGVADDTTAINAAIAAFNSAASGQLYFPAGVYLCSGALTAITASGIVYGDGQTYPATAPVVPATTIRCSSASANFITTNAQSLLFQNLMVENSSGNGATGSGITVTWRDSAPQVDFSNVVVQNFNINIDVQVGQGWSMFNVGCYNPTTYGVKIRNTSNADVGDWFMVSCTFQPGAQGATSAIRIESSGGGKICNCKINGNFPQLFTNGIDLQGAGNTVDLLVSNCSIEAVGAVGINSNGSWPNVIIVGVEMLSIGASNMVSGIKIRNNTRIAISSCVFDGTYSGNIIDLDATVSKCAVSNLSFLGGTLFGSGTARPDRDGSGGIGGSQFLPYTVTGSNSSLGWTAVSGLSATFGAGLPSGTTTQYCLLNAGNDTGKNAGITNFSSAFSDGQARVGNAQFGSDNGVIVTSDQAVASGGTDSIQFRAGGFNSSTEVVRMLAAGNVQFTNAANFSANNNVATVLGSIGPTGSRTTVQKWLTINDGSGNPFYIPCF